MSTVKVTQQSDTHKRPELLTRMEQGVYALGSDIVIRQVEGKWTVEGIEGVEPLSSRLEAFNHLVQNHKDEVVASVKAQQEQVAAAKKADEEAKAAAKIERHEPTSKPAQVTSEPAGEAKVVA